MVPYSGPVKASDAEDRPKDLILHESIKQLVQNVQELKGRTTALEQENAFLKKANVQLQLRVVAVEHTSANSNGAPAVQNSLAGYESSEASCSGSAPAPSDAILLEKQVREHQGTVIEILEKFNEHLQAETKKREEQSKQFTEVQGVLKNIKGRTGYLESKFKTLAVDFDELEVSVQSIRNQNGFAAATTNNSNTGLSQSIADRIEKLQSGLKSAQADVDTHRTLLNELGEQAGSAWAGNVDGKPWGSGGNENGLGPHKALLAPIDRQDMLALLGGDIAHLSAEEVHFKMARQLKALENEKEIERKIDNAATRDLLYEMYHRYTKDLDNAEGDRYDAIWAYRDRVVWRLSTFEAYGKALKEVKSADIGL